MDMMDSKPTATPAALPLRLNGSETTTAIWIEDANGKRVATVANCETDADRAAFIVRACNAHDDLLAACKIGLGYLEAVCFNTKDPKKRKNYANAASMLRAAIAKVGAA